MKQTRKAKSSPKNGTEQETLTERVHRHLSDINSEITDEDIRSVKTELEIRTGPNSPENFPGKEKQEKSSENDQDSK